VSEAKKGVTVKDVRGFSADGEEKKNPYLGKTFEYRMLTASGKRSGNGRRERVMRRKEEQTFLGKHPDLRKSFPGFEI